MTKKEKLILSGITIGLGTVFNLFFSAALHGLLSRQHSTLALIPLWECLVGLFTRRQHLLLFLSFEGFLCLCCVLFFVQNNRPYQSELVKVAGDIYTPAPVGQFQHGSSRWLKPSEKDAAFKTMTIDPAHPLIHKLLTSGYDNLLFLEKDTPQTETGQEDASPCATEVEQEAAHLPVSIKKSNHKENKEQDENFEAVDYVVKAADVNDIPSGESPQTESETPELSEKQQNSKEKKKTDPNKLFLTGGIVIGMTRDGRNASGEPCEKLYYISDDTHTLTIGATRSGKTCCLVIQSICAIGLSGESLVISDPKAELYHYTCDYLKKLELARVWGLPFLLVVRVAYYISWGMERENVRLNATGHPRKSRFYFNLSDLEFNFSLDVQAFI